MKLVVLGLVVRARYDLVEAEVKMFLAPVVNVEEMVSELFLDIPGIKVRPALSSEDFVLIQEGLKALMIVRKEDGLWKPICDL